MLARISGLAFALTLGITVVASPVSAQEAATPPTTPATQQLRLYVDGAYCMGCAAVLTKSLEEGGAAAVSKIAPTAGRGFVIVLAGYKHDANLSPLAKAVNEAATPHRDQAKPGVALEVYAELTEANAPAAKAALAKVPGVAAEQIQTDLGRGTIAIGLTGEGSLAAVDILAALKQAGIEARIETGPAPKPATTESK